MRRSIASDLSVAVAAAWRTFIHRAAGYQAVLLLWLVYAVAIVLTAVASAVSRQRLLDVGAARDTYWSDRSSPEDLASLERPY